MQSKNIELVKYILSFNKIDFKITNDIFILNANWILSLYFMELKY